MGTAEHQSTVDTFEYLRHGGRAMRLRLFRPAAGERFPVVLNLHGGAWCNGGLEECQPRDEALASAGIASAALDFRHAGDGYPASLQDINYAVRWLKREASQLGLDRDRVGIAGQSSGGHLAMLAAMRPTDRRYGSVALEGGTDDASVRCVGMTWPVINPLSRYRYARRLRDSDDAPGWTGDIPERHDLYWVTEEAMSEGNPLLALERKESLHTPPAVWIQGRPDPVHDYRDLDSPVAVNEPERFARYYREAGGSIDLVYIDQSNRAEGSLQPLVEFFARQLL